jgi:hypothetical protein
MVDFLGCRVLGPLESYAPGFAAVLLRQGYTISSASQHLFFIAHLSRWMLACGRDVSALTPDPTPRPRPGRRPDPQRQGLRPGTVSLPGVRDHTAWAQLVAISADLIAWLRLLALAPELAKAEPKALRYRPCTSPPSSPPADDGSGCASPRLAMGQRDRGRIRQNRRATSARLNQQQTRPTDQGTSENRQPERQPDLCHTTDRLHDDQQRHELNDPNQPRRE